MTNRPDISVLIVNFHSGSMTRALVRSLRRQKFVGRDGAPGTLEFIVTDNASGADEDEHLRALEDDGVQVIRSEQNSGYAVGMNLAAERATGDFVLIMNPDVMPFRGSVAALVEYLRKHVECGAVAPRGYLDRKRIFLLPPNEQLSMCALFSETLARTFKWWGRMHAHNRTHRAIDTWTATAPVDMSMVCGFCVMMPTELAKDLGPFDPGYPFYYEDADLSLRLHRRGFKTVLEPRSQMVHFFNRSAGKHEALAWSRYFVSRRRFFRKRYGILGQLVYDGLTAFTSGRSGSGHEFTEMEHLGNCETLPPLEVPGEGPYLMEISADPGFVFAAGHLDVARTYKIPDEVWQALVPGPYYIRFLHRGSLTILRTVGATKWGDPLPMDAELAAAGLVDA